MRTPGLALLLGVAGCSGHTLADREQVDATALDSSDAADVEASGCAELAETGGFTSCCNGSPCRGLCEAGTCSCGDIPGGCPPATECCGTSGVCVPNCAAEEGSFADGGTDCFEAGDPRNDAEPLALYSCCNGSLCRGQCEGKWVPVFHTDCMCDGISGGCGEGQVCCGRWGCRAGSNCP